MNAIVAAGVLLVVAGGCGSELGTSSPPTRPPTESTVPPVTVESPPTTSPEARPTFWRLTTSAPVEGDGTSFTAMVARVQCGGTLVAPHVTVEPSRVVVTFAEEPGPPGSCTARGRPPEPYTVDIGESLAGRQLVDGLCVQHPETGGGICDNGGVRDEPW